MKDVIFNMQCISPTLSRQEMQEKPITIPHIAEHRSAAHSFVILEWLCLDSPEETAAITQERAVYEYRPSTPLIALTYYLAILCLFQISCLLGLQRFSEALR